MSPLRSKARLMASLRWDESQAGDEKHLLFGQVELQMVVSHPGGDIGEV